MINMFPKIGLLPGAGFIPFWLIVFYGLTLLLAGLFQKDEQKFTMFARYARLFWLGAIVLLLFSLGTPSMFEVFLAPLFTFDALAAVSACGVLVTLWRHTAHPVGIDIRGGRKPFEYYVLLSLAALGMLTLVSASHMMTLYVGIELMSLPLYAMIAMRRDVPTALEAAIKYFVLGAVASGLLLFGIALLYGATGELSFALIQKAFLQQQNILAFVGVVFILAGMLFKVAAAPFHMWAPDVYEGATNGQVAIISIASKIAVLVVLVRMIYGALFWASGLIHVVLMGVVVLSLYVGALGALRQENIRRLLAYSGIGHGGFMLMGFLTGIQELAGLFTYMAAYFLSLFTFLGCLGCLRHKGTPLSTLSDLKGLGKSHPFIASLLAVAVFSMLGMPPLAGFWGKLYILFLMVEVGHWVLALLAVLASVISAYYYLNIIKVMYFEEGGDTVTSIGKSWVYAFPVAAIVLFGMGQGILEPFMDLMITPFMIGL